MKTRYGFAIVAVALVFLLWAAPVLADKSYHAERYDVVLEVQPDGALVVTETVRFRFSGGPFTYAFRDLAYTELDGIDRLQASMDGVILPQGTGAGQVEVVARRPLKVTWHFAPTSDSTHEFVLVYRVQGAIRQEDAADALIWRAIPEEHDYPITSSTITLRYPGANAPLVTPELTGAPASRDPGETQVRWTTGEIGNDESLVVAARFAPGSLVQVAPQWQSRQVQQRQNVGRALEAGSLAGVLASLVGLAALAVLVLREGRIGLPGYPGSSRLSAPPDATPPGLAVRLAGGGTPSLATLFDLAGRGLLRIEETGRGLLGGKRYSLRYVFSNAILLPHEQGLLRALFEVGRGADSDGLPLSQAAHRLASHIRGYDELLDREMEAAGWIDPRRKTLRSGLLTVAVMALLLGAAAMVLGSVIVGANTTQGGTSLVLGAVGAGLGAALALVGLVTLIAGGAFSPLSEQGELAAGAWRSFHGYLRDVARGREASEGQSLFERYLPYAAGFGLGERWAKHFQRQGYGVIPAWFRTLDASSGDFGAVVACISSTNASVGGDGGGGAAGGASGGGASGAG